MPTFIDLSGQKFGKLTAHWPVGRKNGLVLWLCSCECGQMATPWSGNLRRGSALTCGCSRRNRLLARNADTHHMSCTPTWNSWDAMLKRCGNSKHQAFHNYGGRGITVCERWHKFENFLADMGERPTGKTLDRINNDGNYEPGNCRWATTKEQAANKRPRKAVCGG